MTVEGLDPDFCFNVIPGDATQFWMCAEPHVPHFFSSAPPPPDITKNAAIKRIYQYLIKALLVFIAMI